MQDFWERLLDCGIFTAEEVAELQHQFPLRNRAAPAGDTPDPDAPLADAPLAGAPVPGGATPRGSQVPADATNPPAALPPASGGPPTPDELAAWLVQWNLLTPFQAEHLLGDADPRLVFGNNLLLDKLGEGGMGIVYRAFHRRLRRPVAVKILSHAGQTPELLRRFQREVEALARVSHPNIVTAYDAGELEGVHFLVMEYVEGEDLSSMLQRCGPLPLSSACRYVAQVAEGLGYAHRRGVVHRDIKPANLLVDAQGTVKILDLGLASFDPNSASFSVQQFALLQEQEDDQERITANQQIVGTLEYMAPEQADGRADLDGRADIYSLGCTLYRLLTGIPPFTGETSVEKLLAHRTAPIPTLSELRADAPPELDQLFREMVAKHPADRPGSMEEVMTRLRACEAATDFELNDAPLFDQVVSSAERTTHGYDSSSDAATAVEWSPAASPATSAAAVGVDLGTTFSALAQLDAAGTPRTILNSEGEKTTPSVVLFDGQEVIVGREAVQAMATEMEHVAECAKREFGHLAYHKSLEGVALPPQVVQALVLRKLVEDAQEEIGPIRRVVLTVPAYFDEVRRKATQDTGFLAGLEVLDIINEPTAAALAFFSQAEQSSPAAGVEPPAPQHVLVYDLGGGTFDVTVLRMEPARVTALATGGDVHLGGRDWDQRLVDYVAQEFRARFGVDPRSEPNGQARLFRQCEEAKRTLAVRRKVTVTCEFGGDALPLEISQATFEELTADLLARTELTLRETLSEAQLAWDAIDRVLLVGGATRMPAVRALLKRLWGRDPERAVSPDEAVAHGAALYAGCLQDESLATSPRLELVNVNSHSLGVVASDPQTGQQRNVVVIPRNTHLPAEASRVLLTSRPNQRAIRVQIVEGESRVAEECALVGRLTVRKLPPGLPQGTRVEVCFRYESNSCLRVTVGLPDQGLQAEAEVARPDCLTPRQLARWKSWIDQHWSPDPQNLFAPQ